MSDVRPDVDGKAGVLHSVEEPENGKLRRSVLTDDDGGDALAQGTDGVRALGESAVGVAVCVDEPRGDREAPSVVGGFSASPREIAHADDEIAGDAPAATV